MSEIVCKHVFQHGACLAYGLSEQAQRLADLDVEVTRLRVDYNELVARWKREGGMFGRREAAAELQACGHGWHFGASCNEPTLPGDRNRAAMRVRQNVKSTVPNRIEELQERIVLLEGALMDQIAWFQSLLPTICRSQTDVDLPLVLLNPASLDVQVTKIHAALRRTP